MSDAAVVPPVAVTVAAASISNDSQSAASGTGEPSSSTPGSAMEWGVSSGGAASKPAAPSSARKLRKDELTEGIDKSAIVAAAELKDCAIKAGYLNKRSAQGVVHNWKKRWIVLNATFLYYYESPDSKKPQGASSARPEIVRASRLLDFRGVIERRSDCR